MKPMQWHERRCSRNDRCARLLRIRGCLSSFSQRGVPLRYRRSNRWSQMLVLKVGGVVSIVVVAIVVRSRRCSSDDNATAIAAIATSDGGTYKVCVWGFRCSDEALIVSGVVMLWWSAAMRCGGGGGSKSVDSLVWMAVVVGCGVNKDRGKGGGGGGVL
ncbi:Hypothetical predicted protein [Olea europaea subsp. europaea]|uniref:Transmembrane protein n=1 Tax=Olea europaea subsp. europaea TaxID=158383 RepID=A0A8S0Q3F7_OLEEU|nr:Hypothetical predicted protein [Olea europaea subsp. europaea]